MYAPVNFILLSIILGINIWIVHNLFISKDRNPGVVESSVQVNDGTITGGETIAPDEEVVEHSVVNPNPEVEQNGAKKIIRRKQTKQQETVEEVPK